MASFFHKRHPPTCTNSAHWECDGNARAVWREDTGSYWHCALFMYRRPRLSRLWRKSRSRGTFRERCRPPTDSPARPYRKPLQHAMTDHQRPWSRPSSAGGEVAPLDSPPASAMPTRRLDFPRPGRGRDRRARQRGRRAGGGAAPRPSVPARWWGLLVRTAEGGPTSAVSFVSAGLCRAAAVHAAIERPANRTFRGRAGPSLCLYRPSSQDTARALPDGTHRGSGQSRRLCTPPRPLRWLPVRRPGDNRGRV